MRNFTVGRTAATLLARITAFETWNIVNGETQTSLKWSTSMKYPGGNIYKERAIKDLLEIMRKSGHGGDLKELQNRFGCALCDLIDLRLYVQVRYSV